MCFSLVGRLQTRAITLLSVLLLAIFYASARGDLGYFWMFFWMVGIAFLLDFLVYSRLIGFQPRWLTILLGGLEFFILLVVIPGPTNLGQMLGFYLPAWFAGWLTMEVAIPLAWPRWAEEGGEFRRLK
ncbi:MAG TPA: hypothetical protein PK530_09115 [Anaerolineales bacterium]|nr:hypothetical protein [Anaerolineales bacterium]